MHSRLSCTTFLTPLKMCSVQDSDVPLMREAQRNSIGRKCMKCKDETAIIITRVNDAFCRACFQVYVTHKFRAAIGKTKLVRDGELVLLAYSGGPSSSALLHLVQMGLSEKAHKKLRFRPGVVFIDEGATTDQTVEERLATCEKIQAIMQATGFPCYVKSLEEGLDLDSMSGTLSKLPSIAVVHNRTGFTPVDVSESSGVPSTVTGLVRPATQDSESLYSTGSASVTLPDMSPCSTPTARTESPSSPVADSGSSGGRRSKFEFYDKAEEQLKQLLKAMKSASAKEDFIRSLRYRILEEVASHCGYSKVMLGDCGSQLAVRLLTDMSTGRGATAAMDTVFADRRRENMLFLKPLRDFSSKEVAMYNNLHDVETVFIPTLTTKGDTGASIQHLTETFVMGLQADYPSTVSNIMRTGEKLDSSKDKKIDVHCALCKGPVDTNVGASSAVSAVEFSQQISQKKRSVTRDNSGSTNTCCGQGDGSCQTSTPSKVSREAILASLCYGCCLAVKDMDDITTLPEYALKDVAWRCRRDKMMNEIKDFILEDS